MAGSAVFFRLQSSFCQGQNFELVIFVLIGPTLWVPLVTQTSKEVVRQGLVPYRAGKITKFVQVAEAETVNLIAVETSLFQPGPLDLPFAKGRQEV